MYIKKIVLTNIKGFSKLEFNLDRGNGQYAGWTVFTGDNGAGKSTVLKAITIALVGKDVARQLQPSFQGWIREGETKGTIHLDVVVCKSDDQFAETGRTTKESFVTELSLSSEEGKEPLLDPSGGSQSSREALRTVWHLNSQGWFVCGYGPFRRVFGASPEAARQMVSPSTERFVTMFHEAASLAEVDQWLRDLNHKSLENRPSEKAQLDQVLEFLRDGLLPDELQIDKVDSDGLWLKDHNGVRLSWFEMSDGYRAALALLGDILRHLIRIYGIDNLIQAVDGKLCVQRSGVVLVDEIDAHLHPEWQRKIGFWLKERFPKIQFLVTTHSPIICQAADTNGLFFLPAPGAGEVARPATKDELQKIVSSRADTILLSPAFGLQNSRSPRAVEARANKAKLEAKGRIVPLTEAEQTELDLSSQWVNPDESA